MTCPNCGIINIQEACHICGFIVTHTFDSAWLKKSINKKRNFKTKYLKFPHAFCSSVDAEKLSELSVSRPSFCENLCPFTLLLGQSDNLRFVERWHVFSKSWVMLRGKVNQAFAVQFWTQCMLSMCGFSSMAVSVYSYINTPMCVAMYVCVEL